MSVWTLNIKMATTTSTRTGQVMMAYKGRVYLYVTFKNKRLIDTRRIDWMIYKAFKVDFYLLTLYYINHIITILFYNYFILCSPILIQFYQCYQSLYHLYLMYWHNIVLIPNAYSLLCLLILLALHLYLSPYQLEYQNL